SKLSTPDRTATGGGQPTGSVNASVGKFPRSQQKHGLRTTNSRECYSEAVAAGSSEDRAPPFEGGGRRFESSPAVHHNRIAEGGTRARRFRVARSTVRR